LSQFGVYLSYSSYKQDIINVDYFDAIFKNNTDIIAAFSYISSDANNFYDAGIRKSRITDKAKINGKDVYIRGVQPGIFEATIPVFN